jgi:hypothetical protein
MTQRHNEMPVLPDEATDLAKHVDQCARRYNALVAWHYEISRRLRKADWISWTYRTITLPAVLYIAAKLSDWGTKLP